MTLEKEFYSISEIAEIINEKPSLIRFWEKKMSPFLLIKRDDSQKRVYTKKDLEKIKELHYLIKSKGYKLEYAVRELKLKKFKKNLSSYDLLKKLKDIRSILLNILEKK